MISLDRRSLLISGGAGVGLIVAFLAWPREPGSPLSWAKGETVLGPYIKVSSQGTVTIAIPQAETGQGAWTGLAQIAADELGAAWEQVAVEPAPFSDDYTNPIFSTRITADSTSIRAFELPIRNAAGVARGQLVRAAAERWSVEPSQCTVGGGFVRHSGRSLAFAELAERAAQLSMGSPEGRLESRLAGQALPRLDLPAKSDGSMRFAGDVRLPGMLFAAARIAPPGGQLTGFDRAAGLARPGVREFVSEARWIASVAESGWAAEQALKRSAPRFSGRSEADTAAVDRALASAMEQGTPTRLASRGDYEAAVGNARALAATYRISPALHEGLEPLSATARFAGGRLEVWAPAQAYDVARQAAARAAAIDPEDVILYPMPIGDNAGQAIESDAIPIAIGLARKFGRPIQLTLSVQSSTNHDRPRPPLLARMGAMPSPAGSIAAWSARFVTAPGLGASLGRMTGRDMPFSIRGAAPPYAIPSLRVDQVLADLPIECGYMRGGSEALSTFANESFVDEVARNLAAEPLAFRMTMLSGNPRLARALVTAAQHAGWDGGGTGSRMGLACVSAFGSSIALVAFASVDSGQKITVERLVAAVDCGRAINPGLIRQQVEGGLLHALSLATAKAPQFIAGMPVARGATSAGISAALPVPDIDVQIVASSAEPGGVSGLAHCVLAPAVANALAASTGRRLRALPFDLMSA